jgi:3-phenylpropionate/trans-cinnamate dioxygenase ferredoxin subunit
VSHDNGVLLEGEVDPDACTVECPRHGAKFDLRTGKAPEPARVRPGRHLPVSVEGDVIRVEVD